MPRVLTRRSLLRGAGLAAPGLLLGGCDWLGARPSFRDIVLGSGEWLSYRTHRLIGSEALARECDVVIVVGGANSNNTRELAATCSRFCRRVHAVRTAEDLRPEWLAGAEAVGLTAGTSTPDEVIDAVERRLAGWAACRAVGTAA